MADSDRPSQFVVTWAAEVAGTVPASRRALDLAMGRGRHALVLAATDEVAEPEAVVRIVAKRSG